MTPEQTMERRTMQPNRTDGNTLAREESPMDLSDSLGQVNLSGILDKNT